jgi:hypothetical protein
MRLLLAVLALSLSAGSISDAERQKALDQLAASRARLMSTVESMTPQQWTFKSAPDRWSPAECVEHMALTEQRIFAGIQKSLAAPPDAAKFDRARDEVLLARMPDRSRRAQAPEEVRPVGRPEFATVKSGIAAFDAIRAETVKFVRETPADLRAHGFKHFAFGDLDAYQWLVLVGAHSERHTRQIEEVKTAPNWPK